MQAVRASLDWGSGLASEAMYERLLNAAHRRRRIILNVRGQKRRYVREKRGILGFLKQIPLEFLPHVGDAEHFDDRSRQNQVLFDLGVIRPGATLRQAVI